MNVPADVEYPHLLASDAYTQNKTLFTVSVFIIFFFLLVVSKEAGNSYSKRSKTCKRHNKAYFYFIFDNQKHHLNLR